MLATPRFLRNEGRGALADGVSRDDLAGGVDDHLRARDRRPLIVDSELAEPINFISPKIDAHRSISRAGEHVDDRTPHREVAAGLDLRFAPIPRIHESLREVADVDLVADPNHDRVDLVCPRSQALHKRTRRSDDDARCPLGVS